MNLKILEFFLTFCEKLKILERQKINEFVENVFILKI